MKFNETLSVVPQVDHDEEEDFEIPNRPVTRSMDFTKENVDADSSDSDEASPSLNPQAEPFVPQALGDPVFENDDSLSEHSPLTSTPIGLYDPITPSASTYQVEPMSSPRIHSMIKAHPPSQMLSSTALGVRTR